MTLSNKMQWPMALSHSADAFVCPCSDFEEMVCRLDIAGKLVRYTI